MKLALHETGGDPPHLSLYEKKKLFFLFFFFFWRETSSILARKKSHRFAVYVFYSFTSKFIFLPHTYKHILCIVYNACFNSLHHHHHPKKRDFFPKQKREREFIKTQSVDGSLLMRMLMCDSVFSRPPKYKKNSFYSFFSHQV